MPEQLQYETENKSMHFIGWWSKFFNLAEIGEAIGQLLSCDLMQKIDNSMHLLYEFEAA